MITIIIPTFDRPQYLRKAIESVLSQSVENFEILIVNNGSTEIDDYTDTRVKVVKAPFRCGASLARNLGAAVACFDILIFLDDDDYFPNDYLNIILNSFYDCDLMYTSLLTSDGMHQKRRTLCNENFTVEKLVYKNYGASGQNLTCKKAKFLQVGGFPNMRSGEDRAFAINCLKAGYKIKTCNDTFVNVRLHSNDRLSSNQLNKIKFQFTYWRDIGFIKAIKRISGLILSFLKG